MTDDTKPPTSNLSTSLSGSFISPPHRELLCTGCYIVQLCITPTTATPWGRGLLYPFLGGGVPLGLLNLTLYQTKFSCILQPYSRLVTTNPCRIPDSLFSRNSIFTQLIRFPVIPYSRPNLLWFLHPHFRLSCLKTKPLASAHDPRTPGFRAASSDSKPVQK